MTEGAGKTVEETLQEAAQATSATGGKKERKPRNVGKMAGEGDGATPATGGKKERKPKEPKAPREKKEKIGKVQLLINGTPTTLQAIQNDAVLEVVGEVGSREGSKRAERAKAFAGAKTVQDFFANGGVTKDLLRHLKSGAVKLTVNGEAVTAVAALKTTSEAAEASAAGGEASTAEGEASTAEGEASE